MADYKVRVEHLWQSEQSAYARLNRFCGRHGLTIRFMAVGQKIGLIVKLAAEVSDLSEDMRQILNRCASTHAKRGFVAEKRATARFDSNPFRPFKTAQVMYQLWLGAALMTNWHKIKHRPFGFRNHARKAAI